ncbi:MAG TPA: transglycosylase SLT domain-containing protein [Bacteroidia bacterium]|jgi:LysM repeat protein|nr:transglycosylase SLT domain-containing protein [Bacteroidia bacterium]
MLKVYFQLLLQKLAHFKRYFIAIAITLLVLSSIKLFIFSFTDDSISDSNYEDYFNSSYKVFSIRIPKNLNFAGEKTPIRDFSVREAMERELVINTYWQSQTLLLHKRANRWFTIIEPILEKNGIPDDFKYIPLIESQLTNVVSPQGATGFWQLVEPTARQYGLEITEDVDERYNVAKSTEAACKYFKEAYKQFNNWTLVAASYNLGMTGVQSQLDRQKVSSYYDVLLTEETARYIYRLLAMKEIISRPKVYGFILRKKDLYPVIPTKKITIDSTIHSLADFALTEGINYKYLKLFNPWLRTGSLNNPDRKKYILELPKNGDKFYDVDGNYYGSDVLTKKDSVNLVVEPHVFAPKDSLAPKTITHLVKEGETLESIAKLYNTSSEELKLWNKLPEKSDLKLNQELTIFVK